jgi:hypothetical protein
VSFRKEAFANFYRSFEFFVTNRILKAKKLKSELNEIVRVLRMLDVKEEAITVFYKELYRLRSEQVMHSQKEQVEITWDDVGNMKLFTDITMQAFYKPIWEKRLAAQQLDG